MARSELGAVGHGGARAVLRPLREHDADEVVELYRAAFGDARPIDGAELISWLRNPEVPRDNLRVLELEGRVRGYGDIWIDNGALALEVAAPGHWPEFLDWAEEAAREAGVSRVRTLNYAGNELADIVARRGYQLWRSAYTMQIELGDTAPEALGIPDGIDVRTYQEADADALRSALNEAFASDPFFHQATPSHFEEFYLHARGFDPGLWLLAWDRADLAGFILSAPERMGDPALGWIQSLGVRRPWRGRGIGESVMRAALRALHARGLRTVGLGVDAGNETRALRLYERVGMHIVRRQDNWALDLPTST